MKPMAPVLLSAACVVAVGLLGRPMRSEARDFGVEGQAFPIIEPDLLATIEARLHRAEASGELARMNEEFARRVEAKVRRPDPVSGITPARAARRWAYDPTISIEQDIRDQKGNLVAAAGHRINPLDFVAIRQDLVFIDGDDEGELDWAMAHYAASRAKIIFVNGSPIDRMTARKRRFYFDQEGRLTGTFGIRHTPAVVRQTGRTMQVSEIVLKPGGRS